MTREREIIEDLHDQNKHLKARLYELLTENEQLREQVSHMTDAIRQLRSRPA